MTNNGTGWEECNMVSQNQTQYAAIQPYGGQTAWFGSKAPACQAAADHSLARQSAAYIASHTAYGTVNAIGFCDIKLVRNTGEIDGSWTNVGFWTQTATVQVQDGWKPATDAVAQTKLTDKISTMSQADFSYGTSKVRDAVNEIMQSGNGIEVPTISVDPIPNIVSPPVTTTSTITNPDGSQVTVIRNETKTTTFPVTNNNTAKPTISQNDTKTVTSTNEQGQTTSTETTTQEQQAKDDLCSQNPDSIACQSMDTPSLETPKRTETISYTAENLGFGGGACPSPVTWTDFLGTHSINFGQYCDVLTTFVKPVVLACALLMAVFIVMPGKVET